MLLALGAAMADPILRPAYWRASPDPARSRARPSPLALKDQPQEPLVRRDAEPVVPPRSSRHPPPRARAGPPHGAARRRAPSRCWWARRGGHLGRRAASGATRPHAVALAATTRHASTPSATCGRARPLAGDTDHQWVGHAGAARRPGRLFPRARAPRAGPRRALSGLCPRGQPGALVRGRGDGGPHPPALPRRHEAARAPARRRGAGASDGLRSSGAARCFASRGVELERTGRNGDRLRSQPRRLLRRDGAHLCAARSVDHRLPPRARARIAGCFALEDAETFHLLKIAHDPEYARFGPGQLLVRRPRSTRPGGASPDTICSARTRRTR